MPKFTINANEFDIAFDYNFFLQPNNNQQCQIMFPFHYIDEKGPDGQQNITDLIVIGS
jgi:hypothetical protein